MQSVDMIDIHTHTIFGDGKDTPEEMAAAAFDKGVTVFGCSEHFPRPESYDYPTEGFNHEALASGWFDYVSSVARAKRAWEGRMTLLFGTEVDYLPAERPRIEAELSAYRFDYLIGSVHMIDTWGFDYNKSEWEGKDVDAIYETYYDIMEEMVATRLFDIVGHLDLVKVFSPFHPPKRDHTQRARILLRSIKKLDMTVEINTGALRKPVGELSPSPELIREAVELAIPLTVTSDAHRTDDIAYGFDGVYRMLRELGVRETIYYVDREPFVVPLPG
ncbi:MAG: histidinol-phosphatase [Deltaproteobacteria bacterium]|nr:histidinol-phosphatase [Candidatus Zymogenaceae bacterium]